MNKVLNVILSEYGYDEPIFTKDLNIRLEGSISYDALRQNIKRLADNGDLLKVDSGTYYVPRKKSVLKRPRINFDKIISRKYIKPKDEEIIGYTGGINFANMLGFTSQTASITTVVTNATGRISDEVTIGMKVVKLRKPKVKVTSTNYKLLQVLDLISESEKICEVPLKNSLANILDYINDVNITQNEFNEYLNKYTKKTVLQAYELGLNNVFTRR